jgi:hypothetical protein
MRRRVLGENPDLPAQAQEALFATTMLFERIICSRAATHC